MSAYTQRFLRCDKCGVTFNGSATKGTGEGITEVRKRARADGWTHPSGWIDYCPYCSKKKEAS